MGSEDKVFRVFVERTTYQSGYVDIRAASLDHANDLLDSEEYDSIVEKVNNWSNDDIDDEEIHEILELDSSGGVIRERYNTPPQAHHINDATGYKGKEQLLS